MNCPSGDLDHDISVRGVFEIFRSNRRTQPYDKQLQNILLREFLLTYVPGFCPVRFFLSVRCGSVRLTAGLLPS